MHKYVHGDSQKESDRLNDQADSLAKLVHFDEHTAKFEFFESL